MRGSERTEKPTDSRRSKEERREAKKKEEKPESYSRPEPDIKKACSRYRELAADHTQATRSGSRREPEQVTRSQVQQIRLDSQLRTL